MPDTVANTFNKYLRALYDVDDPIYKELIAKVDGTPAGTILKPEDFDNGAIAGIFEWTRQLTLYLQDQLQLDTASGKFFELITQEILGITKYEGESNAELVARIQSFILDPKVSEASIIAIMTPYSSPGLPEIIEGSESAFADATFSDNYSSFQNTQPGNEFNYWIMPAIAANAGSFAFFFILRLENTTSSDLVKVVDILSRWVASGINYEIQIVETP